MREQVLREGWIVGATGLMVGLLGLGTVSGVQAEPEVKPTNETQIATSSVAIEKGLEALLREQAIPPTLFPEIYTSFPQAVPPPIVGGLQAEIE